MKFAKTETGMQLFKLRSGEMTPRLRSAFILFDGKKTDLEVLSMAGGLGLTAADIAHMVELGWLVNVGGDSAGGARSGGSKTSDSPVVAESKHTLTPQERYARAWPIATQITASLGFRGLRLNLAVEGAADYDALRDLLPKIREAAGPDLVKPLEQALKEQSN